MFTKKIHLRSWERWRGKWLSTNSVLLQPKMHLVLQLNRKIRKYIMKLNTPSRVTAHVAQVMFAGHPENKKTVSSWEKVSIISVSITSALSNCVTMFSMVLLRCCKPEAIISLCHLLCNFWNSECVFTCTISSANSRSLPLNREKKSSSRRNLMSKEENRFLDTSAEQ